MNMIGTFQAKTHFSELLRRVQRGESFKVTNRGQVVAVILPPQQAKQTKTTQAFTALKSLRRQYPLGSVKEIMDWKNEGRK